MKYIYSKFLGVHELSEENTKKVDVSLLGNTPNEAKLLYFKNERFLIKDRIRKAKEGIKKNEKILKKLEDEFSFLYDLYPEEFI